MQTVKTKRKNKKSNYIETRNIFGELQILSFCNYDIDLIRLYIKTGSKSFDYKLFKRFKELITIKKKSDKLKIKKK